MNKSKIKYYRSFAIALIIAMMFSTIGVVQGAFADKKQTTAHTIEQLTSQDKEIINEISNMTGVKAEEIIKLKTSSNTWNDVLDKLKSSSGKDNQDAALERSTLLAESGLEIDYIKKLKNEGFADNKIIEAKSLVNRVTSQLKQILDDKQEIPTKLANGLDQQDANKQEFDAYKELAGKIDLKTAVELLLKLEKDFGSMEKVFDEYLLSLQIGVDLKDYLIDKKAYEKLKSEQSTKFDLNKMITMATIEAKVLQLLQNESISNKNTLPAAPNKQADPNNVVTDGKEEIPASPLPDVQNPKPSNPMEDLMKEVNDLKNKSLLN